MTKPSEETENSVKSFLLNNLEDEEKIKKYINTLQSNAKSLEEGIKKQKESIDIIKIAMYALVITSFLAFVTFIIDSWRFQGNNRNLQIEKIEKLEDRIMELEIQNEVNKQMKKIQQNLQDSTKNK